MKLLIVVHHHFDLWNVPPWFRERLSREFPQLQVTPRANYDGIEEDLRDAEILFTISLRRSNLLWRGTCAGFTRPPPPCINCCFQNW